MRYCLIFTLLFTVQTISAQEHHFYFNNITLPKVLNKLEKEFEVKFSYPNEKFDNIKIILDIKNDQLDSVLQIISAHSNIVFHKISDKFYYLTLEQSVMNVTLTGVTINAFLIKGISLLDNGSFKIDLKNLGLIPGNIDADIFQGIQQLPGVYSFDGTSVNLNVHGGKSDYNQILWNDIPIYHRGHLFGMISPFNANPSQTITYFYKNIPLQYNNYTSSVIAINTTDSIAEKMKVNFGINGLDGDFVTEIPVISDKLGIIFSMRHSYENLLKTLTFKKYQEKAFYGLQIDKENYSYSDLGFTANYYPNKNNHLKLNILGINNNFENIIKIDDSEHKYISKNDEQGFGIKWKNTKTFYKSFIFSYSDYTLDYHHKTYYNSTSYYTTFIDKLNDITNYNIQSDFIIPANKHRLNFGLQSVFKRLLIDFKEYKDVFYHLETEDNTAWTHHLYITDTYKKLKKTFKIGGKISYYTGFSKIYFDPLISFQYKFNKNFTLQINYEQQRQDIFQINETFNSNNYLYKGRLWRIANGQPFYPILRKQITNTYIFKKHKWLINTDLYYSYYKNLSGLYLGYLFEQDNQFQTGTGKTFGLDFFIKRRVGHFNIWLKYNFTQSSEKFDRINNGQYFTSSQQVMHILNSSIIYHNNHFQAGLSWLYRSGSPYTRIIDGYLDEDHINEAKLPDFQELNCSVSYNFKLIPSKDIHLKAGISLRNILNNHMPIGVSINGKNTLYDELSQDFIYSLPFTPNFMLRLSF
ncbi:MAG: DUF4974 domain-containing protein [Chlorobi bacterium]|nr:DUF4974 domain-containing protein [Chlorobiota bacterium]